MAVEANKNLNSSDSVTVQIDGQEVVVTKGTNLIEAAKQIGIEVPYYCYHPDLSVPGNCRMCQLEIEGAPKLMIGCHTQVTDGMKIKTHKTSKAVADAQAATLEMILINHPLDCTVCDQAGHCKLQDYHYEYNARPSRFLENKEKKPKAVPLGPTVMLDAERCIACTRCVRFCDEVTKTGELGLLNRGDRYTIAVNKDRPLDNPFSGVVVDLCPVGALTHRNWRFNTRIWYATPKDSVCPGCSTGCSVKVYERDGEIVQVKSRYNKEVNKDWLCDEGRYGYPRFVAKERITSPLLKGEASSFDKVTPLFLEFKKGKSLIILAADLYLEEYAIVNGFKEKIIPDADVVLAVRTRQLSELEKILVSPDYAPNMAGAYFSKAVTNIDYSKSIEGDNVRTVLEGQYLSALNNLKSGQYDSVILIGDSALTNIDLADLGLLEAIGKVPFSLGLITDKDGALSSLCKVALPSRSVLEKSGLFINSKGRLQYCEQVLEFPEGTYQSWRLLGLVAEGLGHSVVVARNDRDLTLSYLEAEDRLKGLTIRKIKGDPINGIGVDINNYQSLAKNNLNNQSGNVSL